jgi:hypothetical protein
MKNTHVAGFLGVLVAVVGLLVDPAFSSALVSIFPPTEAQIVSKAIVLLGLAYAYFGRPVTVPASPETTVTVTPAAPATATVKESAP